MGFTDQQESTLKDAYMAASWSTVAGALFVIYVHFRQPVKRFSNTLMLWLCYTDLVWTLERVLQTMFLPDDVNQDVCKFLFVLSALFTAAEMLWIAAIVWHLKETLSLRDGGDADRRLNSYHAVIWPISVAYGLLLMGVEASDIGADGEFVTCWILDHNLDAVLLFSLPFLLAMLVVLLALEILDKRMAEIAPYSVRVRQRGRSRIFVLSFAIIWVPALIGSAMSMGFAMTLTMNVLFHLQGVANAVAYVLVNKTTITGIFSLAYDPLDPSDQHSVMFNFKRRSTELSNMLDEPLLDEEGGPDRRSVVSSRESSLHDDDDDDDVRVEVVRGMLADLQSGDLDRATSAIHLMTKIVARTPELVGVLQVELLATKLVDAMRLPALESDVDFNWAACALLVELKDDLEFVLDFAEAGGVTVLVGCLQRFRDEQFLLDDCLNVLAVLVRNREAAEEAAMLGLEKAVERIWEQFSGARMLQQYALSITRTLKSASSSY